jgi:anthranilate/para-aminobenzoate synthase component II
MVTSRLDTGEIMSVRHNYLPIYGTQFHPESILTEYGKVILNNWLTKK